MSAPKRTRNKKVVWLKPQEITDPPASFRKRVLGYLGAEIAFAAIRGPGLNEELIWSQLWELACRANEKKRQASRWYSVTGLPMHSLRRFPLKVRSWADDIENVTQKINTADAYSRTTCSLLMFLELQVRHRLASMVPESLARGILEQRADLARLSELPKLLRLYADQLEAVCKFTAHHASEAPGRFRASLEFALVEYVKRMTGKPHFPQIATLLSAAYSALGSREIVDAHSLSAQYRRQSPWKR